MSENAYQPPKEVNEQERGPSVQPGQPRWIIPAVVAIFVFSLIAGLWYPVLQSLLEVVLERL
jgi:hypothetical protein